MLLFDNHCTSFYHSAQHNNKILPSIYQIYNKPRQQTHFRYCETSSSVMQFVCLAFLIQNYADMILMKVDPEYPGIETTLISKFLKAAHHEESSLSHWNSVSG